ncbi:hypothetical protein LAV84_28120 [Rhizobium sp. VS19-DR104.2]|uniref:hypothetical protein n=1 Tax=unclassified Rhizobium TaxID=2613769 RepID=UPI001C5BA5F9|nr:MULTISPECIES: hypothetical protein [unclassified Rhizobium]MBZ5763383.1 hypothetical protein [Rhizobium sp. VS19-DR96]MBZ5769278.1 hypothetical protein [Rhizobium sp. VS19-DR129.2]MBZ5776845.1 hypothetical protein [Rhizobium sp. VS19-DRK62.2]MBZ5787935.1 hypothetical protein [Rhizobium sp. VS19-DR121]MBZ5805424.1 hypothetical protein [Rhizobium sp. VS19-DR181]
MAGTLGASDVAGDPLVVKEDLDRSIRQPDIDLPGNSALKPAAIPIIDRPPFRFEAGHHSNQ